MKYTTWSHSLEKRTPHYWDYHSESKFDLSVYILCLLIACFRTSGVLQTIGFKEFDDYLSVAEKVARKVSQDKLCNSGGVISSSVSTNTSNDTFTTVMNVIFMGSAFVSADNEYLAILSLDTDHLNTLRSEAIEKVLSCC